VYALRIVSMDKILQFINNYYLYYDKIDDNGPL